MDNSLFVIEPYRQGNTWVFDDEGRNLYQEPFVAGVPEILDRLVSHISGAEDGFRLIFSASEFPGYSLAARKKCGDVGGTWYSVPEFDSEGWLCPALFKFFPEAPACIYVRAEAVSGI